MCGGSTEGSSGSGTSNRRPASTERQRVNWREVGRGGSPGYRCRWETVGCRLPWSTGSGRDRSTQSRQRTCSGMPSTKHVNKLHLLLLIVNVLTLDGIF